MTYSVVELPWLREPPADYAARCRAVDSSREPAGRAIQFLADFRLDSRRAASLARAIRRARAAGKDLSPLSPFRLGVLASATYELMHDDLIAAAARHGVALE